MSSTFVYVTYIRTTPEKLWEALTSPEFTKRYWFGITQESEFKPGSPWKMRYPDGAVTDTGKVLEVDPPRRLVLQWRHDLKLEFRAEGETRCEFELVPKGNQVQLRVTHSSNRDNAKVIAGVSEGWPQILSSLKSLLETGMALERTTPPIETREGASAD